MTDWTETTLEEITVKIGSGATPRGGKDAYAQQGIALIRSMNVLDGRFDSSGLARISNEQAAQLRHVAVCAGDVLVNITGASVARSCVVPERVLPARVNQHVAIVRLNPSQAVARFVNAYLVSPEGKGRLLGLAAGGATREALTKATLERFQIRLPPISVQLRVSEVLSGLDELIENNRRRVEMLEEMARAIYREWFVDFRYPDHKDVPPVDSPLGPIPEGWETKRLDEMTTQLPVRKRYDSKSSSQVGTVPVLDQSSEGVMGFHDEMPGVSASLIDPVFTFANHTCAMRLLHKPFSVIQNVFPKVGREGVATTLFAYHAGRDRQIIEEYKGHHPRWRETQVVLPPLVLQARFTAAASPLHQMQEQLLRLNGVLTEVRDEVLPRLVNGRIDMSSLDLDALVETGAA